MKDQLEEGQTSSDNNTTSMEIHHASTSSATTATTTTTYYYNRRGQLVVDGYPFVRGLINGSDNIIYWRCSETKKYKCHARVKTLGKKLVSVKQSHNHLPRKEKLFTALVWQEQN